MSVEVRISESYLQTMMSAFREQHAHFNLQIQKKDAKVDVRVAENLQEFIIKGAVACFTWSLVFGGLESAFITLHVRDRLPD